MFSCAPRFGQNPQGEDLAVLQKSPNYANGEFHNQIPTPQLAEGVSSFKAFMSIFESKNPRSWPDGDLPAIKTDLKAMPLEKDAIVWLGHSSYFIILNCRRILVDPVLEAYAAPLSIFNRAFPGTTLYTPEDLPPIDYLLITHDHWDHLEYPTLEALRERVGVAVCGLGAGSHLRRWDYKPDQVQETDWYDCLEPEPGLRIHALPARHFSGRTFTRNKTLWTGYVLETPQRKILISGDSGYGPHFAEAGRNFPDLDVAILEAGQYDPRWPYIHMRPEETAQAALDVGAKVMLPAHNGRFRLANHAWDEPVTMLKELARKKNFKMIAPEIGEVLVIDEIAHADSGGQAARKKNETEARLL